MEISSVSTQLALILLPLILAWGWRVLQSVWITPKKLERLLQQQGLKGSSYKFLIGDMKERSMMHSEAESRPIGLLDDIVPRVEPLLHKSVHKHGKNSFVWFGTIPTVIIMNPDQIKDVFLKISDFQKPHMYPAAKMLVDGLVYYEGEKWATQRKVMTSAFHIEKLKLMLPTFYSCCNEMIARWEKSASFTEGRCEVDAWTELENLTRDMITQAAFGKCAFEEGKRVFELQQELIQLVKDAVYKLSIPGWRFLPTKQNRRMSKVNQEVESLVRRIISKREKAMETSGEPANDLLGYLLESNVKVNQENKGNRYEALSTEDLILECKQFHLAGQLPTLVVLAWTMVLLSIHPEWQNRAREEILQVFGTKKPDFDALSKLKIVSMILYEVMRLYPPVPTPFRSVRKDTQLGKLTIPAGVQLVLPTILIHHDQELWGHDANEFKPGRFSEGLSKATNNQVSFFPFSWGPRMCIGQNFALLEVKMAISMIIQRFWFELSPSYAHAPMTSFLLQPQYGVQVVLHKC